MIPSLSGSILPPIVPPVFPATNFANNILNTMQTVSAGWIPSIMVVAQKLFLDLAGLEVCWSMGEFILQKAQSGWEALVISTAKKILQLSIFFWIVSNANTIFWLILNLFQSISADITGVPLLSPSAIMQTGINFTSLISSNVPLSVYLSPSSTFTLAFSNLLILLSFVIVAGQYMVTIMESYIATSAGILMLGFSGSRFTANFADKYFAYAIGVGIKLLMCSVVVALGEGISTQMSAVMGATGFFAIPTLMSNLYELVGISLIYAFMAWYIPQLASSLASGSVGMTLGAFMATGASLIGSMFAVSKIGGTAVLGGLEKLKSATSAGGPGPSPLSGLQKMTSSSPSYVPPPSGGGTATRSPGGAPTPPSSPPPPGSGGAPKGNPGEGAGSPPGGQSTGAGLSSETSSATPKFSASSGASQTTSSSGSSTRFPSMPSDKADVAPGGPQFKHGESE